MASVRLQAYIRANPGGMRVTKQTWTRSLKASIRADPGRAIVLLITWKRSLKASIRAEVGGASLTPSMSRSLPCDIHASTGSAKLVPSFARNLKTAIRADPGGVRVTYLMRSVLTLPPTGQIRVLSGTEESPLNRATLTRGDTVPLNVIVRGDRVKGLRFTFTAKLSPDDPDEYAVIRKASAAGEIERVAYNPIATNAGNAFELKLQITLLPRDTNKLDRPTLLYYDLQADDGLGEVYTIEGKRGEYFIVTNDVYRGRLL